jgi:hypothetical protein
MPLRARLAVHVTWMAAFGGLFLRTLPALGEPPPSQPGTILLLFDVDDTTARRLAAELRASGLEVKSVESPLGTHTLADVDLQSRSVDAAGAVDIDPATREVRIWTVDRSNARLLLRSVVPLDEDSAVLALRVVEMLRASLSRGLELASPSTARSLEPMAPPRNTDAHAATAEARPSRDDPQRLAVTVGPAFGWGGGPWAGAWEGMVSAYWLWTSRWGMEVFGAAPLTKTERVVTAGTAALAFGLAGAGMRARALATPWCVLDVGAGIGAGVIRTDGSPNAGYSGTAATTSVATPYVRMAYAIQVASFLWLQAEVTSAVAIPRTNFTFPGGEGGAWGSPLVLGSVGIQVVVH